MARPNKQSIEYFPLDVDIDGDDKLAMIIAEFGEKGELIYIKLLGWIYGKKGYYTEWSEMEQLKFVKRVSYISGASMNLVKEVVSRCVRWGLFDKAMFDTFHVLTSVRIQQTWMEATRKRKDRVYDNNIWLLKVNSGNNPPETPLIPPLTQQSKGEESKGKETNTNVFGARSPELSPNRPDHAPTWQAVQECFYRLGRPDEAISFFEFYEGVHWMKGNTPIANFTSFASRWTTNDIAKKAAEQAQSGRTVIMDFMGAEVPWTEEKYKQYCSNPAASGYTFLRYES